MTLALPCFAAFTVNCDLNLMFGGHLNPNTSSFHQPSISPVSFLQQINLLSMSNGTSSELLTKSLASHRHILIFYC